DYLYVLTGDKRLSAIETGSGRVRWVTELPGYKEAEAEQYWIGSMLVAGRVLVIGEHGQALWLEADSGKILQEADWPEETPQMPAVAGDRLYTVSRGATLYILH